MALYIVFLISALLFGAGAAYVLLTQKRLLAEIESHEQRKHVVTKFLARMAISAGIVGLRTAYAYIAPRAREARAHARMALNALFAKFEKRFANTLNMIAGRVTLPKGSSSLYMERISLHKENLQKGSVDYDFLS